MKTLVVGLVLAAALGAGAADAQEKVIRIPFSTNFTGQQSAFGERLWRGGQLAAEEINAAGGIRGGHKIEFYKVDARSEAQGIVAEYRRACTDPSVPLFWANFSSRQLFAIYEYAKECNLVTFAASSGGDWVYPDQGKWIYRYLPATNLVLPVLYQKLKDKLGVKTAALSVAIDNDFAVHNAKLARKILDEQGIKLVVDVGSKTGETNFASQVAAVNAAKPDVVILSHLSDDGGKVALQLRERGLTTQIADTGYTIAGRDFWNLSQGHGKGAIGSSIYTSSDPRPIVQDWIARWRKHTGEAAADPDPFETATYDAVKVLAKALNAAVSMDRKAIADSFLTLKNVETISGTITYRTQDLPDVYRSDPILVQLGDNGRLIRWGN